jgi:hypothetical protein
LNYHLYVAVVVEHTQAVVVVVVDNKAADNIVHFDLEEEEHSKLVVEVEEDSSLFAVGPYFS